MSLLGCRLGNRSPGRVDVSLVKQLGFHSKVVVLVKATLPFSELMKVPHHCEVVFIRVSKGKQTGINRYSFCSLLVAKPSSTISRLHHHKQVT